MQDRAAVAVPLAVNQVRGPPNSATWQPLTQVRHLASSRCWSASAGGKAAVALRLTFMLGEPHPTMNGCARRLFAGPIHTR